ncbi:L-threonylcarbamoyladenylate synthase [Holophaga foetida]|uniref:L-threonylcarbamoyladenylate synthase n=1 Tax=Holophaga foetida TaxID=35839 RepID=UPI0002472F58|nr:L-threonylcarbamoyladenylate synthase [Holophaga foetida]
MILSLHPDTPQQRHLERILEILTRDGVIAYPTDTLYGLGCLISRKKAVDRILTLKHRDPRKPMSILCADMEMLCRYARHMETSTFRLLKQLLPGPYTVILPASREVPRYLQAKQTVGLRIPDNPFCTAITKLAGEPILSTSANLYGEPPLLSSWEIQEELGHALDMVVDCGEPVGESSTILDLTGDEPLVLRQGAGPWPLG